MGRGYSSLVVERVGDMFQLQQRTCPKADTGGKEEVTVLETFKPTAKDKLDYHPALYMDIYLRLTVDGGKATFAYSLNGKTYKAAGEQFTMREGKWVGAKQKQNRRNLMADLQEYKCPCCGGAIAFDSQLQKMKCPYCDTEFEMETLKSYDSELQGDKTDKMDWETSAGSEWTEGETDRPDSSSGTKDTAARLLR